MPHQTTKRYRPTMKTILLIVLSVSLLCSGPVRGADPENKTPTVEERLREADLNIALKQYERVRMEEFEASLKFDLLPTEAEGQSPETRKKRQEILERRMATLRFRGEALRKQILKLGNEAAVAKSK